MLDGRIVADTADGPAAPQRARLMRTATARPASRPAARRPTWPGVASVGLRTRRLRAALSALGIAIGVAAIVAVLGLSASSQAGLLAEIDRLGTNLLTVANGRPCVGDTAETPARRARHDPPDRPGHRGGTTPARSAASTPTAARYIPSIHTNALGVQAASLDLPADRRHHGRRRAVPQRRHRHATGRRARRRRRRNGSASTGSSPASGSGSDGRWFYVAGILNPAVLAPEIDSSILVGFPAAADLPRLRRPPLHDLRAGRHRPGRGRARRARRHRQPRAPRRRSHVSQPSDALVARAEAKGALNEPVPRPRRRRPARRRRRGRQHHGHLRARTALRDRAAPRPGRHQGPDPAPVPRRSDPARPRRRRRRRRRSASPPPPSTPHTKHWATVLPPLAWAGGLGAALAIGAVAGLLPAVRAARLSPTEALWSM